MGRIHIEKDNYPYIDEKRTLMRQVKNLTDISFYYQDVLILGETEEEILLDKLIIAIDDLRYYYKESLEGDD